MGQSQDPSTNWNYPGSRWWKFDFHTHTPASLDTTAWQEAKGTPKEVTPEKWLLKYMQAGIDCVAVTDHNSGAWIDGLKSAYQSMKARAEANEAPEGFRKLTIFPGVELSVSGGFHLLAIFDLPATTSDIDSLLGKAGYNGTKGDSDAVTSEGPEAVIQAVLNAGGIPIPAHADGDKGLLQVEPNTRKCQLDANTIRQTLDFEELVAMEWLDIESALPSAVEKRAAELAQVLGSDSHNFRGAKAPGCRFTWIKMARPNLEGLRLALLDGNNVSVKRSPSATHFQPFHTPEHFITAVEVQDARYMGRGQPARLSFNPYYNALIGGRGTGKSSVIHAIRLAYQRRDDLNRLEEHSEPRRQFESFADISKGRHDSKGALRPDTEIRVEVMRDGIPHRLRWRSDGTGHLVEEKDNEGKWQPSNDSSINAERFPIRLFSQGQIAALAGENRQALLDVIDEAANLAPLRKQFEEARQAFYTQRAQWRELKHRTAEIPAVERNLADIARKLEALSASHHQDVLKAYQRSQRQNREVNRSLDQLDELPQQIKELTNDLQLDDWSQSAFDASKDTVILQWRQQADALLQQTQAALNTQVADFENAIKALRANEQLAQWQQQTQQAEEAYQTLQTRLAEQGVEDPKAFQQLLQERQRLESRLNGLKKEQQQSERLQKQTQQQHRTVRTARQRISEARQTFLADTLGNNPFVRMQCKPLGFDAKAIERDLREALDIPGDKFASDILTFDETTNEPTAGLAYDLAVAQNKDEALKNLRRTLLKNTDSLHGHFQNHLNKKRENQPGFSDQILCWFPEDDLKIEYGRTGKGTEWSAIDQGSQGQRSAALLAFLLAFGTEPLVLDQPEDDLDNHLIYDLIVQQIRKNKLRRQLIIVTHNANIVVNGDAEMVHTFDFTSGQCRLKQQGALQEKPLRDEVCRIMEGGQTAFSKRWARLGKEL